MPTVNLAITDTADDGTEFGTGALFQSDSVSWNAGFNSMFGVTATAFLRFLGVDVPNGATVSDATLTVTVVSITGTPDTTWFGVDEDDVAQFASPGNLPTSATTTTASVDGDPPGTGVQSFDVTAIVQEIIDRAGWASGNAMAFVCKDNAGSGNNLWQGEDLEDGGGGEASLEITYTAAASNNIRAAVAHQRFHNRAL